MAEDVKAELLAVQKAHLDHAQQARRYMQACIADAKAVVGDWRLGTHDPLSGPAVAHYSFDYAQQVMSNEKYAPRK